MKMIHARAARWGFMISALLFPAIANADVYLNLDNISVAVGAGTAPGTFNNTFASGATIDKAIDAPSADALEFHNQSTHIWFTADTVGSGLELEFDFGQAYDISYLHFWNYTAESYDVDNVDFTFFNGSGANVGSLSIQPNLGSSPGIAAQDILLPAPINVQSVKAMLTGSNREVDFQNIGFTASVSAVPEPSCAAVLSMVSLIGLGRRRRTSFRRAMA